MPNSYGVPLTQATLQLLYLLQPTLHHFRIPQRCSRRDSGILLWLPMLINEQDTTVHAHSEWHVEIFHYEMSVWNTSSQFHSCLRCLALATALEYTWMGWEQPRNSTEYVMGTAWEYVRSLMGGWVGGWGNSIGILRWGIKWDCNLGKAWDIR